MAETKIEGLEALYKQMQELPLKVEKNIMRGALQAGQEVFLERARELVPVKSEDLRNSLRIETSENAGEIAATLIAGDEKAYYAHIVEGGAARHFIKPKNKKALSFAGVAVEGVDHPGAKKQPFMRPAFDAGNREAIEAVAAYVREHLPQELNKV